MVDQISNIEDEPFPSLYERLCQCESEDIDDDSGSEIPDELIREIFVAYVEREKRHVEEHLQGKDIAFFAASAESALEWKNRSRKQDPYLDPEATGIPAIVRHFLRAPANTNLRNYHNHVTKVLPAWRARALRALTKHTEDEHYAKMREDLSNKIPRLAIQLRELVPNLLEQTISVPWSCGDEPKIIDKIKELFDKLWKDPKIMYTGWRKMLRENGIPVAGVYVDRNLNEDVLSTIEAFINDWAEKMTEATDGLAERLLQLVKDLLSATLRDINICNSTPELKDAAADALGEIEGEIEASYDTLLNKLNSSLDENHLRFTTELDIECPIAKTMKPSYERALDERFVQGGKGIYKRQKKVLKDSMLKPKKHYVRLEKDEPRIQPLVDTLKEKLISRQRKLWTENCTAFIDSVIEKLEEFGQTAEDLLTDADFMSQEHQEARAELKELLVHFDERLDEVQEEFANLGLEAPVKRIKLEPTEDSGAEPTFVEPGHFDPMEPASEDAPSVGSDAEPTFVEPSHFDSTEPAPEDVPSVPILQNLGWHHFLSNLYPLGS